MKNAGIAAILSVWFENNRRDLPWRKSQDPYKIWISEIILQQTRVVQGTDYYRRFIRQFPDVSRLAAASIDEVMNLWKGLGYYSRARHLHETARIIVQRYGSVFPAEYKDLLALRGIGDYTAAAIASIAFNKPVAVVDGNVYRVLSRLFGIHDPVGSVKGMNKAREYARQLLDPCAPGQHNQAMMEFGALQCIPFRPDCLPCPLKRKCFAYLNGSADKLPARKKKNKRKTRHFHYLIIRMGISVFIRRREEKDIWKWLYEFPLIETEKSIPLRQLAQSNEFIRLTRNTAFKMHQVSHEVRHVLSHQLIKAKFYLIDIRKTNTVLRQQFVQVEISHLDTYAFPRVITQHLAPIIPSFSEEKD
jgi:A/G-specific adenine glycosylase